MIYLVPVILNIFETSLITMHFLLTSFQIPLLFKFLNLSLYSSNFLRSTSKQGVNSQNISPFEKKRTEHSERFSIPAESEREKKSSLEQTNGRNRTAPETTVSRFSSVRFACSRFQAGENVRPLSTFGHSWQSVITLDSDFHVPFVLLVPSKRTRERTRVLSPESESSSHCVFTFYEKQSEGILPRCFHDCLGVLIVPRVKSLLS